MDGREGRVRVDAGRGRLTVLGRPVSCGVPSIDPMTVATAPLGVPGYTFADLHEPERLESLYNRFCEETAAADPQLWADWDAYRRAPDAPRPPVALSNLLIAMTPHLSRFVKRLFAVDPPASAIAAATRAQ